MPQQTRRLPRGPGAYILIQRDARCHTQMCAPLIRFSPRGSNYGVEPRADDPEQEDEDKCEKHERIHRALLALLTNLPERGAANFKVMITDGALPYQQETNDGSNRDHLANERCVMFLDSHFDKRIQSAVNLGHGCFLPTTLITQGRSGVLPFPANRLPVPAKLGDASRQSHRQFENFKFSSMSCATRQERGPLPA